MSQWLQGSLLILAVLLQPLCCCYGDWISDSLSDKEATAHSCCESDAQPAPATGEEGHVCPHEAQQQYDLFQDTRAMSPLQDGLLPARNLGDGFLLPSRAFPGSTPLQGGLKMAGESPPGRPLYETYCVYRT